MQTMTRTADGEADGWRRWRDERIAAVRAPFGPASLVETAWLGVDPREISSYDGSWSWDGEASIGAGLLPGGVVLGEGASWGIGGELRLVPGAEAVAGEGRFLLRGFAREGVGAVRIYAASQRAEPAILRVDAFPYSSEWRVEAHYRRAEQAVGATRRQFDGHESVALVSGWLEFDLKGHPGRLAVSEPEDGAFFISFGDTTNADHGVPFRFLDVPAPGRGTETTTIDFNFAYLPPCVFSDQFVCPLPLAGNRLPLAIPAGERTPVRS